ncbi:MAG: hypothetical protein WB615_12000 [Candidatus Tumulicola sp.]
MRHSMASNVSRRFASVVLLGTVAAGGCSAGGGAGSSLPGGRSVAPAAARASRGTVGLGVVLATKNNGQIFGFDIDQNGSDGVLATAANVETFNEDTGQISKSIPQKTPAGTSYGMDGIFGSDVGLITRYVVPKGSIYAKRYYNVMSPVTKGKFDAKWKPPIPDVDVQQGGANQSTSTSVLFAIELKNQDKPDLFVTNIATNTVSKVIHLNPNEFGLAYGPQLGQYTSANEAVIAYSPDGGAAGGVAPVNAIFNLQTGQETQFNGYNNGPYHAGDVNGLAVDPNTGIAATTTELNAQVEFYDLNKKIGIAAVQLPCTNNADQTFSGSGVAVDPVNKLFIVSEQYYCEQNQGSALVIYDEQGNLVETITGFTFSIGEPAAVINPGKRMGWTFGPHFDQLQQFFY